MDAIKIVYLGFYLGFNLFFAVFFIIGIRMIIKWIYFKNRKKNFTIPAKIKYVNRTKLRSKISGWEYRYTYKVKAQGATVESTIDSIANEKTKIVYPMDENWNPASVNPENHSEFRLPSEDNAIKYYRKAAIILLVYGIFFRILFELVIWGPFLEEGGLR